MPSYIGDDSPIFGISIRATSNVHSPVPSSTGGATGVGRVGGTVAGGAVVVVVLVLVLVVVGASAIVYFRAA
jgi:hypothetical protein